MADLIDRVQELTAEAEELGLADRVHARDIELRIMGYADVLGYDVDEAMDPELPLRRVKPAEQPHRPRMREKGDMSSASTSAADVDWDVLDQILIEVAAELSGETFDTEIEWTPELLEIKESVMKQFKDKPHTTIDFIN